MLLEHTNIVGMVDATSRDMQGLGSSTAGTGAGNELAKRHTSAPPSFASFLCLIDNNNPL